MDNSKTVANDGDDVSYDIGRFDVSEYAKFVSLEPCDNGNFDILDRAFASRIERLDYVVVGARNGKDGSTAGFLLCVKFPLYHREKRVVGGYTALFTVGSA